MTDKRPLTRAESLALARWRTRFEWRAEDVEWIVAPGSPEQQARAAALKAANEE